MLRIAVNENEKVAYEDEFDHATIERSEDDGGCVIRAWRSWSTEPVGNAANSRHHHPRDLYVTWAGGDSVLQHLHAALGWQGGTVHDALAHVRELRERAEALTRILRLLNAPTVKDAGEQIHAGNCSKMIAEALVKAAGTASYSEVAQMRAKAESLDALLETIGVKDVELAKRLIINERAVRLEAVKEETVSLADLREALLVPVQGKYTVKHCLRLVTEHTKACRLAWMDKNMPAEKVVAPASTNTDPDSAARDLEERWRAATSPISATVEGAQAFKAEAEAARDGTFGIALAGILSALRVSGITQAHVRINELHVHEKGLAEIRRVAYDANPLAIADLLKRAEEDRQSIHAIRNSFAELDATPTIRNVEEPIGAQVAKLFDAICGAMCETDLSRAIQGAECNYHLADLYRAHAPWLGETIDATVISLGGDPPEVVMVARVEPDVCQRIGKNPGLYSTVKVVIGEGA